ncbi:MAG: hypothetical protein ACLGI6_12310, partial [Gammaproteobacteria bacterium]
MTSTTPDAASPARKRSARRTLLLMLGSALGTALVGILILVVALAMAYPNLPPLDNLTDYRPKMPLRI